MAGISFTGAVLTHNSVAVTHLTSYSLNVQGGEISQIVADSVAALTLSQPVVKGISFTFALPAAAAAATTLLEALNNGTAGTTTLEIKDSIGGTVLTKWTSSDALGEAQGASVTGSGGAFTLATCTINTNGGGWTTP